MPAVSQATLLEQLQWRYAVKKFDPARTIDPLTWQTLEQSLVLTASSYGLQPWKFFVVDNPAVRAQLRPAAWNQSQITDAAKLVVFAIKKPFTSADVDRFIERIAEVHHQPVESLEGYKKMMSGAVSRPAELIDAWSTRQVYIALGNFLTSAAVLGVDACPMEGFEAAKFDEILGLAKYGAASVVVATAGYRAADDHYAERAKVRFKSEDVIVRMA